MQEVSAAQYFKRFGAGYVGRIFQTGTYVGRTASGVAAMHQQASYRNQYFGNRTSVSGPGGPTPVSPQTNCRIWWDASIQAYRMTSSYNKQLVDEFKKLIPYSDRSYDDQTRIWTFTERYLGPTQSLLKLLNVVVTLVTRQQVEQASQSNPGGAVTQRGKPLDAVLAEFVRLVPYEAMQKAYRHAALLLHPDRNPGGSTMDQMSALNAAWDRIQKEVYKQ